MRAIGAVVAALAIAGCGTVARSAVRDATVTGKRLPATFTLLGVANPKLDGSQNCSPTIPTGNAYLVYLTPFRTRRNAPPAAGRFWVVGGPQGNYIHTGTPPSDPQERSFVHQMSDVGRSLPQRISIADARRS